MLLLLLLAALLLFPLFHSSAAFGALKALFPTLEQRAALVLLARGVVPVHPFFHAGLVRAGQVHADLVRPRLVARVPRVPVNDLLAAPKRVLAPMVVRHSSSREEVRSYPRVEQAWPRAFFPLDSITLTRARNFNSL